MRNREFLGQGLTFPLQVDPRGGIALAAGERDIEQAIRLILATSPGERVMRPEFGCRIHELIFAPNNAATEGLLIHYIKEALHRWEPRIEVLDVIVTNDTFSDSTLLAEVRYLISDSHNERSIVYPFFLMGEE
ncbi:MAG: GPW/gp25 family protein [Anaerolineae bacterium]|nr:GPW/gp25 family protein [Anaerolineae bacterium]